MHADAPRLADQYTGPSNDYHHLPVSHKQLRFARSIAARASLELPDDVIQDRRAMSAWIDTHLDRHKRASAFSRYPSSKQVAFAERIARIKRRDVPRECFRDKGMMSRWIDSNR
jgi:hypothetical protein